MPWQFIYSGLPQAGKWLSRLCGIMILVLFVGVTQIVDIHGHVLEFGEDTWDEYFLLRSAHTIPKPSCERNPDIDKQARETTIPESAHESRKVCQEKWQRYQVVQQHLTTPVVIFSTLERTIAATGTFFGNNKRSLLCLLVLFAAIASTLQRRYISLCTIRTRKDYLVHTLSMGLTNAFLLAGAIAYRSERMELLAEGSLTDERSFAWFWISAFGTLTAISVYRLYHKPRGLEPGGSWGKAILTVPLLTLVCLLFANQMISLGFAHGTSVLLGILTEVSTIWLELSLTIWICIWLYQRVEPWPD